MVCEGLNAVFALEDGLKVVGHAHDGEEACVHYKQFPRYSHPGPADAKMDGI
jgi:YesN/AraC family two-component response regulator